MTLREKFRSAIKRGTGETHLIMMENPKMDFSSDIIKAALTNYAYDSQSEGSRADYCKLPQKSDSSILDKIFNLNCLKKEC